MFGRKGGFVFHRSPPFLFFMIALFPSFSRLRAPLSVKTSHHAHCSGLIIAVFKDKTIIIQFGGHRFFPDLIGNFQYCVPRWVTVTTLLALPSAVLFDWSVFFLTFKWIARWKEFIWRRVAAEIVKRLIFIWYLVFMVGFVCWLTCYNVTEISSFNYIEASWLWHISHNYTHMCFPQT